MRKGRRKRGYKGKRKELGRKETGNGETRREKENENEKKERVK